MDREEKELQIRLAEEGKRLQIELAKLSADIQICLSVLLGFFAVGITIAIASFQFGLEAMKTQNTLEYAISLALVALVVMSMVIANRYVKRMESNRDKMDKLK